MRAYLVWILRLEQRLFLPMSVFRQNPYARVTRRPCLFQKDRWQPCLLNSNILFSECSLRVDLNSLVRPAWAWLLFGKLGQILFQLECFFQTDKPSCEGALKEVVMLLDLWTWLCESTWDRVQIQMLCKFYANAKQYATALQTVSEKYKHLNLDLRPIMRRTKQILRSAKASFIVLKNC